MSATEILLNELHLGNLSNSVHLQSNVQSDVHLSRQVTLARG